MRIIQNLSIRNKLIGIILFVTIVTLGIGFTFAIINEIKAFKREMMNRTIVTAQSIGENCVGALTFRDRAGAERMLAKLAAIPSIENAILYDTDGERFAAFASSEDAMITLPAMREPSSEFVDHCLHVFQPIVYENEYYGTIYLRASTQSLNTRIKDYLRYMVSLMVGLIVVSIFLTLWLQRCISQPILNLAGVAQQITEEGNYSIRVQKMGNDEIGLLYDGFNDMLDQIENRETERDSAEETLKKSNEQLQREITERKRVEVELAKYQEHLEELVERRTLELTNANKQLQQEVVERKRTEEERESLRRLSQRLTGPLSVKEVGRIVAAESRHLFGHDAFTVDLLDRSIQKLSGIYYEDTPSGAAEPEEVPAVSEYAIAWRRDVLAGRPKLINRDQDPTDTQLTLATDPFGDESRMSRSLMFVPIFMDRDQDGRISEWENETIGMLSVQSYTPDRYSERDLKLLQTFADQCGGTLVRVRAEEALRESEHGLAEAQRIAHLGNWDWNIITNELLWSDEIYRICGLQPQEFGATYDAFLNSVHPDDRESVKKAVSESLADPNAPYSIEHRVVRPDGSERVVHEQGEVILDDNGKPIRMVGTVLDITERVQAKQELEDALTQLAHSEKMASLGMLVAGVAHEINTPVGAISSMHNTLMRAVERLKSTVDTIGGGELNKYQNTTKLFKIIGDADRVITSGTERVTNIVRRLRSFARLDEAELKKVDIHQGIEDTLTIVHHELKHKAVVERNFGNIPPIACYPAQLNQVYVNLLINAVQAIEDKGTITVTTFQKDDHVHIQIVDTGVGIPKESLSRIFDPGVTTKSVGVGTGLGLSICYRIIKDDHHGEILVESEVGKGTTFTVILPMNLDRILNET